MATRRPLNPRDAAEALFSAPKKVTAPAVEKRAIPGTKELVSLKIDSDVLAHFQEDGPGWQERMNDVLRAYTHTDLSINPGKFQLPLAQNRGAPHQSNKP